MATDATGLTTIAKMRPEMLASFAQIPGLLPFANHGWTRVTNDENIVTEVAGRPCFGRSIVVPAVTLYASRRREADIL